MVFLDPAAQGGEVDPEDSVDAADVEPEAAGCDVQLEFRIPVVSADAGGVVAAVALLDLIAEPGPVREVGLAEIDGTLVQSGAFEHVSIFRSPSVARGRIGRSNGGLDQSCGRSASPYNPAMRIGVLIFGILLGGLVFGLLARMIVPARTRMRVAETTLVGIAGSGVGAFAMNLSAPGSDATEFQWWTALGMLIGAVVVYALTSLVVDRIRSGGSDATVAVATLIAAGESHRVEFKQTARWNVHTEAKDPRIELVIAKTVAGFLNADGGTLIVGIDDDGQAVGLDEDLTLMKEPDLDRYELWLMDHLERCLGKPALSSVRVSFEAVTAVTVCRIDVTPAPEAVFLDEPGGGREADMYVRMGNSTRKLLTDEAIDYARHHWRRSPLRRKQR